MVLYLIVVRGDVKFVVLVVMVGGWVVCVFGVFW